MAVLLLAEVSNGKLNEATAKALTAAKALNEPVHVLVAGEKLEAAARTAARLCPTLTASVPDFGCRHRRML